MDFEAAVAEIEALPSGLELGSGQPTDPRLGVGQALSNLGLLERINPSRIVVVAGTNGKGSTCAFLESLLKSAGQDVLLFTSPHLERITERLRRGSEIQEADWLRSWLRIRPTVLELGLTRFQALTVLAMEWGWRENPPTWAILEIGIGGLLDPVNAVPHHWNCVTSLGRDHEAQLGGTLTSIARNKLGIVSPGSTLVFAPFPDEAKSELAELPARIGDFRQRPCPEWKVEVIPATEMQDPAWILESPWGKARLGLPGARAAQNAMLALTLFEELGFEPSTQLAALESTRWPGRMERLDVPGLQAPIYLSGDHNPQGMESLLELLRYYPRQQLRVFAAVAKDKDAQAVLGPLLELPDAEVTLTRTPFKGTDPVNLPLSVRSKAAHLDADLERAWEKCLSSAKPGDLILVTGSLYLVGWVRSRFTADRGSSRG